jgi:catalase
MFKYLYETISDKQGKLDAGDGKQLKIDHTFTTADPVLFDAIYAVGGPVVDKKFARNAAYYVTEAFGHFKPIGATHDGKKWLDANGYTGEPGVVTNDSMKSFADSFIDAIAAHRHWSREV